jgi:hypothetical protein
MSEFKFNIVGKDGKVIEDLRFDDIDAVADYMLDAADKWYSGLQDPGDNIIIERIEDGKVVFEDKSSFGGDDYGYYGPTTEAELDRDLEAARQFIVSDREVGEEIGEDS